MYYVYLLVSVVNGKFYVGSTNDLKRRLMQHNKGRNFSTKRYFPWKLIYFEAYVDEVSARLRERKLKHHGNALRELKKRINYKNGAGLMIY